jgi:hypothetical protein
MAVRLAEAHGVSRTSAVLDLDYYSVRKRVETAFAQSQTRGLAFVEWPSPIMVGKECRLDLDNRAGRAPAFECSNDTQCSPITLKPQGRRRLVLSTRSFSPSVPPRLVEVIGSTAEDIPSIVESKPGPKAACQSSSKD